MRFSIFQESRKGGREANQDRTSYAYTRDALLMVVADGMGGHLHGEVASQIAAQQSFHQKFAEIFFTISVLQGIN